MCSREEVQVMYLKVKGGQHLDTGAFHTPKVL